jgi:hypothetical protein
MLENQLIDKIIIAMYILRVLLSVIIVVKSGEGNSLSGGISNTDHM